ncbi:isoprenylcysteine carboxyl methyltransferase family protein [Methylobrevis pamukkalensis]|uniref:Isoprenylcysteine carboxyl methyltransferase (ICMT) family protein n=1 Tax=Methylobrevis pamukkalensis TaxID=1439726 RepID=A0A1E3H6B0_9HYPH|nr:isoprenylcysteine carboxylmethyltransferase family protein [Methylobrevis pamukkalensis]ODN71853.1 Isoprenylcysteine carboxyl methyltransferase (ICMT) family protein [Methylobrevis pamukkalensis]
MTAAVLLLALVTAERLGELWLARRNTAALLARGAHEVGAGHYPVIVALHVVWLAVLWWFGWDQPLDPAWLAVFGVLQVLRFWVLGTLGRRWTTRIIVLPGAPLVTHGPYRYMSHPNYAVVVGEIAVLPLCLGLPLVALVFSLANAVVLFIRIRCENRILAEAPQGHSGPRLEG